VAKATATVISGIDVEGVGPIVVLSVMFTDDGIVEFWVGVGVRNVRGKVGYCVSG